SCMYKACRSTCLSVQPAHETAWAWLLEDPACVALSTWTVWPLESLPKCNAAGRDFRCPESLRRDFPRESASVSSSLRPCRRYARSFEIRVYPRQTSPYRIWRADRCSRRVFAFPQWTRQRVWASDPRDAPLDGTKRSEPSRERLSKGRSRRACRGRLAAYATR